MKLGIALSGGGIRGIAHAGVLKALEDNQINIDIIGGTSAGSMIASLYAMGYSPYYIYMLFKKYAKDIAGINTNPILGGIQNLLRNKKKILTGLKSGEAIEKVYDKMAARKGIKEISQIKMPLVIPSVDITESKEYVFTNRIPKQVEDTVQYIHQISVGKAVRASSSFPAVFSPCKIKTHAFMDGGTLDNIPVYEVKKQGADKVIAVKFDADPIDESSNLMDIVMKTIDIMGSKISEESLEMSDYVLNVYTDKVGLLDTQKLDSCYQYGYQCVIDNLEAIKQVLE
ncbi:MAG: patatin-like phospholipase family protein [Clostridia bacterium]